MNHSKVLIEPIAESKDKMKVTKTDKKVLHVEKRKDILWLK